MVVRLISSQTVRRFSSARFAGIITTQHGITVLAQGNFLPTTHTNLGFKGGRIFELFEVVGAGSEIGIDFCFKLFFTYMAVLPSSLVSFREMKSAQSVTSMIAMATISSKGKEFVIALIITNPLIATLSFGEFFCFTAGEKMDTRHPRFRFCDGYRIEKPLRRLSNSISHHSQNSNPG
ncbi:MAG: hypothetical protein WA705_13825 [Candidatus Ozemobacteraceae bacterium]